MLLRAFVALTLLLGAALARADVPVPALAARVTDQTGTLDAAQRAALEAKLAGFEQVKGSQIAILIVPSTEPETIEQYSIRVAEQWKLGRKGVDDGLLILVARNDRTVRIEVGYGLEGVVPDAIAHRVIDEIIVPKFRGGDYYGGLDAGVDQLIKVIDGEPLPPPPERSARSGQRIEPLIPVLIAALIAAQFLRRVFGAGLGSVLAGGSVFGLVWLLSGTLLLAAFFGFVAFMLTLFGVAIPLGGGGWSSRGGGGFGGGGFGGGGGGFGGGGASGRW
ncbi:TPM domain-containing protein [Solimonas variicoloris]|uniref:TPM domain-containing protein n=1 Tax=Solimonas variicoloris TaxID=254408 RepID=UPI00035E9A30|nr:YgcG family protein [Solimonas variicoloris]